MLHGLLGFGSIEQELICILVLSVILVILLLFEYRQKQLEKKLRSLKEANDKEEADKKDMPHEELPETTPPTDTCCHKDSILDKNSPI